MTDGMYDIDRQTDRQTDRQFTVWVQAYLRNMYRKGSKLLAAFTTQGYNSNLNGFRDKTIETDRQTDRGHIERLCLQTAPSVHLGL